MSNLDNFEKVGEQLGSNPGGTYKNKITGELYYLKFPYQKNSKYGNDIAKNEVLAGKLYQLAAVKVPELSLLEDKNGNFVVASKIEPSFQPAYDPNNKQKLRDGVNWHELPGIQEGLAADAWLANWDVAGLQYDNIGTYINPKSNKLESLRLDTGGSLIFRAQGELKGDKFNVEVPEIDSLRGKDPNTNNNSVQLFVLTTDSKIEEGVKKLSSIKDEDIINLVNQYGPGTEEEKKELAYKLIVRKSKLEKRFSNIDLLLSSNQLERVYNIIQDKENSEYFEYAYSPLNKNIETKIFEKLVHALVQDPNANKKISFIKDINGRIILNWDKEEIDFVELIDKVNFNHLSITDEDINKYADYVTTNLTEIPEEKFFRENIKNTNNPDLGLLDYGEMIAIRTYTANDEYKQINQFLRNCNQLPVKSIQLLCLHVAIASHGLNKLPDVELPSVIRYEAGDKLEQYLEDVKKKKIMQEKAFISTSIVSSDDQSLYNKRMQEIAIIYQNVHGKDISPLSNHQEEKEYLIPPSTQIKWTGYQKTKNGHIFTARGANNLLDSEALTVETEKSLSSQKKVAELLLHEIMKDDLINLTNEQVEKVLSDELKGLTDQKLSLLTSEKVKELYHLGEKFSDLKKLPEDQINTLTSPVAKKFYNRGFKSYNLKNLTQIQLKDIWRNLYSVIDYYKNNPEILDCFKKLPGHQIDILTSYAAQTFYGKGFKPDDFINLTEDQFYKLIEDQAVKLYKQDRTIFNFLKKLSPERIELFASYLCTTNALENKILTAEDLTKGNLDQMENLIKQNIEPEKLKQVLLSQTTNPNTKIIGNKTRQVIEKRERSQSPKKTSHSSR